MVGVDVAVRCNIWAYAGNHYGLRARVAVHGGWR